MDGHAIVLIDLKLRILSLTLFVELKLINRIAVENPDVQDQNLVVGNTSTRIVFTVKTHWIARWPTPIED